MTIQNMETSDASDSELLAAWVEHRRESAFHALVARYAALVHMAAKRTVCDESLAADVSQIVFILLARKAKSLTTHPTLAGWLHVTAVMKSRDLLDKTRRENRKLQLLAVETRSHSHQDAWREIQPVLDDALAALSAKDREALLLRFYRALSVREVAATLGIATDAAQKRIDRATARLRSKLARRGVQTGGSLGTAMLAGFAADAQAVVLPVSMLASKAISAGATSAITSISIITALTAIMKSSWLIVPLAVLVLAGALITTQRQSISSLEKETAVLHKQIAAIDSPPAKLRPVTLQTMANDSINWLEFVRKYEAMRRDGGLRSENMGWVRLIEQRLQSMTREQLSAELEQVSTLDVVPPYNDLIREMILTPLTRMDPQLGLKNFMNHLSEDSDNWHEPAEALKKWAIVAPNEAAAWLDSQIAAGKLDSKALDGKNPLRLMFEKTLIGVLLTSDPSDASRRVGILPANQRADVLLRQPVEPEFQASFANLVRQHVPDSDQAPVLAELAFLSVPKEGYGTATECMDRIQATSNERAACIEHVAVSQFQHLARGAGITQEAVEALRTWTASISPESTDKLTGIALGRAIAGGGRQTSYAELGQLAVQYSRVSGNDDVLVEFLKEPVNYFINRDNKQQALALTGKIADENRREEVLGLLDQYFPKP